MDEGSLYQHSFRVLTPWQCSYALDDRRETDYVHQSNRVTTSTTSHVHLSVELLLVERQYTRSQVFTSTSTSKLPSPTHLLFLLLSRLLCFPLKVLALLLSTHTLHLAIPLFLLHLVKLLHALFFGFLVR